MSKNIFATAAELVTAVKAARQQADELIAEVKREDAKFKSLCARKKDAMADYAKLKDELDRLIAENKDLFDALKKA